MQVTSVITGRDPGGMLGIVEFDAGIVEGAATEVLASEVDPHRVETVHSASLAGRVRAAS